MIRVACLFLLGLCIAQSTIAQRIDTPHAINTQAAGEHPPSASEAADRIEVPAGFGVTLFAGEPDVHQPIAMEIDDRGRLWVAECYTYEGSEYDLQKRDRILIFDDTDGDGRFDRRKIFWDQGQRLTGLTLGFGGVWVTSAPNLLFLPDRDHDDRPDGPPQVMLEGFSVLARHNMVNGLRWGPDGWLYGRHGITDTSHVGTPDTPAGKRTPLNCSIWRFHPQRHVFQVVTHGTTNPWGLDYDDHGQWFFTNNVINHLWHVIPGAHYERMHGADFNPYLYGLIEPTADHFHWDTAGGVGDSDNKNRKQYDGRHDDHGGGHSHCGGMIYLGDNWPTQYRGRMLMCNTHGRRVNVDRLVRRGNSYVGEHEPDFLIANNPWFRGVELKYGPDGGVFLTDWSDLGECHDRDGVHRTSGRIYKITYGEPQRQRPDLSQSSDMDLVHYQLHRNDWFVRHARRRLQERHLAGEDLSRAADALRAIFADNPDVTRRLRAMWALYSIDAVDSDWLTRQLHDPSEHVRGWAVRLLVDRGQPGGDTATQLAELSEHETSGLVRLSLASALQQLDLADRWPIAIHLSQFAEDANDRVQPLMIWYGIEPAITGDPERALRLALATKIPLLREYVARRLSSSIDHQSLIVDALIDQASTSDAAHASDYLSGLAAALKGRNRVTPPANWQEASRVWAGMNEASVTELVRELSVVFGDGRAVDELLLIAKDTGAGPAARRDALAIVLDSQPKGLSPTLLKLKTDRVVGALAIQALARYEQPEIGKQLLSYYRNAKHEHRPAIIRTLASRASYAAMLLAAVEAGTIDRSDISAAAAGNIAGHGDQALTEKLEELWGAVQTSPKEKVQLIESYRARLTPERLAEADLDAGRLVFAKVCGTCHKMFGEGKSVGPDLTGSNRDNLSYLLENIIDPSRIVPADLRQSAVLLSDGRVINGCITRQDEHTVTIQTIDDVQRVPREEIERIHKLTQSLMPDGILQPLSEAQVRDLFAFLQSTSDHPTRHRIPQ
ncbi:PVC-type heme-binding CxxCH protein [Stieleria mannarensis]|uniref:PVC-type heme-binding CxxCH protein n=1 Tax=Stieleria mannarensis TaxID=2755585 RepID=UPI0015FF6FD5|nr:PVC-type heme-binding CxxCH protein [Rhodopirellula sp. JC639]